LVMALVTCCESDDRLIEHRHRGDYDLDQLRAEMHLPGKPCCEADDNAARAVGLHLWRLNGPEIKQERTRVFARETKGRHIRMADREALAQSLHERIEIHAAIERTKGRSTSVRALTTLADGMTLRAHSFRQSATALLQETRAAVFGQAGRGSDKQKEDCEPDDHVASSPLATKRFRQPSRVRLRAFRRRSKRNGGLAVETRKRVELRVLLVRLAAQHCNAAERAMLNRRPRMSGH